jgi:hypothetical protein
MERRLKQLCLAAALVGVAAVWTSCFTSIQHSTNPDTASPPGEVPVVMPDGPSVESGLGPVDSPIDHPTGIDSQIDGGADLPITSTGGVPGVGGISGTGGTGTITGTGGILGSGGTPGTGGMGGTGGGGAGTGGIVGSGGGTATGGSTTCTSQTECGSASYCKIPSGTTGTCTAKNPNGTSATQAFECASGILADGVCCDKACTGCSACSGAPLTAAAAGQCAFVVAGQIAHSACTASGVACGLDGKCDGAGTCRYTPAEGASCDDPANLCVTGRVCQSHVCSAGATKTCPAPTQKCRNTGVCDPATGNCTYGLAAVNTPCDDGDSCTSPDLCQTNGQCLGAKMLCNTPPACKLNTTCSAGACSYTQNAADGTVDPNCPGTTPYCYAGTCVRCTSSVQCSGVTPSCDPNTHTCVCRKPTPGNLLKNPGFDGSLANWTPNPTAVYDGNYDADGCPGSGSVYVSNGENDPYQCFPVTAGTLYYLGLRSRGGASGGFVRIHMYGGVNCTGSMITTYDGLSFSAPSDNTIWLSYDSYGFVPPAGVVSADIAMYSMNQWLDQIYVNAQGAYF